MEIRRAIIILTLVCITSYGIFNLDFVVSKLSFLTGNITDAVDQNKPIVDATVTINLFPISGEITNPRITTSDPVSIVKKAPVKTPITIEALYKLSIPSLGIEAPIVLESSTNSERIYDQLQRGIVHYATTPLPGEKGTAIIIGHSSHYPWYKGNYGSIFATLSKLQVGDTFQIEKAGVKMDYKVSGSIVFSPDTADSFEIRSFEVSSGSSVVLMTCWPVGTNAKRIAVKADLVI